MSDTVDKLVALASDTRGLQNERLAALARLDAMGVKIGEKNSAPVFTHTIVGVEVTEAQADQLEVAIRNAVIEIFEENTTRQRTKQSWLRGVFG